MISKHPSDTDIQVYVLRESNRETYITEHLQACHRCKAKTEMYRQLFLAIKKQPNPEFNFDLSATVLPKITPSNPQFSLPIFFVYLFVAAGFACIGSIFYLFREYVAILFSGFSAMSLSLILATTLTVLIFQSIDLVRKYQHKMDELNFY